LGHLLAVLQSFGGVQQLNPFATGQVSNGAGDFQGPVDSSRGPTQPGSGRAKKLDRGFVRACVRIDLTSRQQLIGLALAQQRPLTRNQTARTYLSRGFTGRSTQQVGGGNAGHFDMQVDAIQ
jgi:hypothetical protein